MPNAIENTSPSSYHQRDLRTRQTKFDRHVAYYTLYCGSHPHASLEECDFSRINTETALEKILKTATEWAKGFGHHVHTEEKWRKMIGWDDYKIRTEKGGVLVVAIRERKDTDA